MSVFEIFFLVVLSIVVVVAFSAWKASKKKDD